MHVFRRFHIIPPIQIEQRSIPTNLPRKKSTGNLLFTGVTPGAAEFREAAEPPKKSRKI
jgi:hypothetical protein